MKKLLLILLFLTLAPRLALAEDHGSYQYMPMKPHVEVDWALLGTDDGTEEVQPSKAVVLTPPPAPAVVTPPVKTAQAPVALAPAAQAPIFLIPATSAPAVTATPAIPRWRVPPSHVAAQTPPEEPLAAPPFTAPAKTEAVLPTTVAKQEASLPENTAALSNKEFLDKIVAYHLPPGMETKPAAAPVPATLAVVHAPAETPVNITEPEAVASKKPVEIKPAEAAPPKGPPLPEKKAEVKPAETALAPTPETAVPSLSQLIIPFDKTSANISPATQKNLDTLIAQVRDMSDMRIQIRAYATGEDGSANSARRMSLARALAVRNYLTDKGIKPVRLDVRALGTEINGTPADQVELVFVK